MKWPALDEVEESLFGLFNVHPNEGLVVHGHVFLVDVDQESWGEAVCHHLAVVVPCALPPIVAKLDLTTERA